jgi:hypothetical protein
VERRCQSWYVCMNVHVRVCLCVILEHISGETVPKLVCMYVCMYTQYACMCICVYLSFWNVETGDGGMSELFLCMYVCMYVCMCSCLPEQSVTINATFR